MKARRTPVRAWAPSWSALVLGLATLLAALVAALCLGSGSDLVDPASGARSLPVAAAALVAAGVSCLHWRIAADGSTGLLAVLLAVAGVGALALGASPAPAALPVLLGTLTVTVGAVLRLEVLSSRARGGAVTGLVLLELGSAVAGPVGLGSGLLGGVLLVGTVAALLLRAIEEEKVEVEELHRRLHSVEAGRRVDRARLHEINATVAGIASAQTLMTEGVSGDHTDALAVMMRAEVQRLQRLVAGQGPGRRRSVDLDDVIGQIVLSHLARGRIVTWEPTGLRAMGRADDIAEIVNVLLENAAVHGGPDPVSVRVTRELVGPGVVVSVSDRGPGVPPELGDRIFDWGVGRPGSPGQGIGLHVAADVARDLGARLELVPTTTGATFELHLSAAAEGVGARVHDVRAS
jgi:signal transduction histidine kinase